MYSFSCQRALWVLASAAVLGCTHVAPASFNYVAEHAAERVWVVRRDNDSTVVVVQPREENDTLMGFSNGQYVELGRRDVKQLRAKQAAPIRTVALVAGLTSVAVISYQQFIGNKGTSGIFIPCPNCDFDDVCC